MNPQPIQPITRRTMLQRSAAGFGYLALQAMLGREQTQAAVVNPMAPKPPHFPARAKRIVFLFMKGGPSHVDTFDPKPLLQRDDGKPYPFKQPRVQFAETGKLLKSPWSFQQYGQSGLPVSELFPHVAQHVDDLCILRSVHGTNPAHGGACLKLHTGSDTQVRPSMGSWLLYGLGTENENLPGFLTICPTLAHGGVNNWGAAFLPAFCQGTPLGNASIAADKAIVRHIRNEQTSSAVQRKQLDFLARANREHLQTALRNGSARDGQLRTAVPHGAAVPRTRCALRASHAQRWRGAVGPARRTFQRPHEERN